jgi:hypothetical protein
LGIFIKFAINFWKKRKELPNKKSIKIKKNQAGDVKK